MKRGEGQWNAYVELGANPEERKKRLAEVPEKMRPRVMNHVKTVFALRKKAMENHGR